MTADIWTKALCSTCQSEKAALVAEGYEVTEHVVHGSGLDGLTGMDRDAFFQLLIQDEMFPVVRMGGLFRVPEAVRKEMEWN